VQCILLQCNAYVISLGGILHLTINGVVQYYVQLLTLQHLVYCDEVQ
jgi:hypothetical protein